MLQATRHFKIVEGDGFVPGYEDGGRRALAINPNRHKDRFAAAEAKFTGEAGVYDVTLATIMETDGESTYRVFVDGKKVGEFTNPRTSQDYKPSQKTWQGVGVPANAKVRVEFNTATNGRSQQGNRKGYSRGRWTAVTFRLSGAG